MMLSCSYFIFIDTSISKHVDIFFDFGLHLRTSEVYAWGSWYVHFASCFYINIYCIMGCYYTICHNTYAYSLLFYKVYMKRENADSWNSGLEKEQILDTYSAQLQKSWNFTGASFRIYKKYWAKEVSEGGHPPSTRVGGAPYPLARPPALWAPGSPLMPIFCYTRSFFEDEIIS